MTPEGRVRNEICSYLAIHRVMFFIHDSVGIYSEARGRFLANRSPYRLKGVADILGIYRGFPLAIEVKSARGKLSEHQAYFLDRWREAGGIAIVARSVEDVERGLNDFFRGRSVRGVPETTV